MLRRAAAWLATSLAISALAAVIAGAHDAASIYDGLWRAVVAVGFAVLLAWPAAFVLAVIARAVVAVWRPRALVARLTDEGGGAPRLAGWMLGIVAGGGLTAFLSHQVVWIFWRTTAFKPRTMSTAMGPVMIVVALVVVLVTPVAAAGCTEVLRRLETAWADRRGRPLFTPRRVLAGGALVAAAAALIGWLVFVRPRFANVSFAGLGFPALTLALLAAGHAVWPMLGRRRMLVGLVAVGLAAGSGAAALAARHTQPTLVLSLWGADGFSADAIDLFYDLYAIRDDVPSSDLTPVARPGAAHRDIVLITVDTFRPDRIKPYGGHIPAPQLLSLANRGVLFEYAFAPSNVTRRSMPSIATGLSPPRIRGRVAGWALRMDPRHITVAERLRAGGYHTEGLFCCEGFWERKRRLGLDRGIDDLFLRHDGKDLVAAYQERVRARGAGRGAPPTFTWMHFIELHEWAGGNPDLSPERRRVYDDLLTQIDRWIGEIQAATAGLPPERQPIIIVTGDHSEAFGDHNQPFHSSDLYNSQIRVPLIIAGPGITTARVQEPVGLADLGPTILDLAGFQPPAFPAMDGRSLADLLTGARRPDPEAGMAYAATITDRYVRDHRSALVVGRWKLIHQLGRYELYDLRTDPAELRDVSRSKPDELAHMQQLLDARRRRDRVSPF